jgi:hypothetical protein
MCSRPMVLKALNTYDDGRAPCRCI